MHACMHVHMRFHGDKCVPAAITRQLLLNMMYNDKLNYTLTYQAFLTEHDVRLKSEVLGQSAVVERKGKSVKL